MSPKASPEFRVPCFLPIIVCIDNKLTEDMNRHSTGCAKELEEGMEMLEI